MKMNSWDILWVCLRFCDDVRRLVICEYSSIVHWIPREYLRVLVKMCSGFFRSRPCDDLWWFEVALGAKTFEDVWRCSISTAYLWSKRFAYKRVSSKIFTPPPHGDLNMCVLCYRADIILGGGESKKCFTRAHQFKHFIYLRARVHCGTLTFSWT